MKKRRLVGPLTPIQEQQEALKDVGLPEDLVGKIYETLTNQVINGKEEGFFIYIDPLLGLYSHFTSLNGIKHRLYKKFDKNGELLQEIFFVNGKHDGIFNCYLEKGLGQFVNAKHAYINNAWNGEVCFYDCGKLQSKVNYIEGKMHGEFKLYRNGKLYTTEQYMYGIKI